MTSVACDRDLMCAAYKRTPLCHFCPLAILIKPREPAGLAILSSVVVWVTYRTTSLQFWLLGWFPLQLVEVVYTLFKSGDSKDYNCWYCLLWKVRIYQIHYRPHELLWSNIHTHMSICDTSHSATQEVDTVHVECHLMEVCTFIMLSHSLYPLHLYLLALSH